MNALADVLKLSRESGNYAPLVDVIPYLKFLGISVVTQDGKLVGKMSYSDSLIGNASIPALHGGTIGALLESTALFEALLESETLALPKIVTITVDYLRSGRPVDTYAKGVITRQGKRVVNVSVEAWQEEPDRPIARANAIFIVEPVDG